MFKNLIRFFKKHDKRITRTIQFCPVTFEYNETIYDGFLVDLSNSGAKIKMFNVERSPIFEVDKIVTMRIKTPYGFADSRGILVRVDNNENSFGVSFLNISNNKSDPLHCLINSAF